MRLVFIGPVHPFRGGIAHFTARLTEQLSLSDECLVVSFTRLYPDFLFPGKSQFDASHIELPFSSERILDPLSPISWIKARNRIAAYKPDAVIFHYWHPFFIPAYQSIAKSCKGKAIRIAICHNITPHEGSALNKTITKYFFNHIDGFIVHARSEAIDLTDLKPDAIYNTAFHPLYDIFPGQDISREEARRRLGISSSTKLALYFGLIRRYKGVDIFFNACRELGDVPELKMLAVGEVYADGKELVELVGSMPAGRAELIDRYVSNDEVALFFRAADVIVLPYRSATQSGVVPIAYACDRPVIVTNVGGLPEVVVDKVSGLIIPPEDPHALAAAIREFFSSSYANTFEKGIAEMKKKLSWDGYARILGELIERIK